jgi:hypothetical protein
VYLSRWTKPFTSPLCTFLPVDTSKLYQANTSAIDKSCKDFAGIIRAWPAGKHAIKISMRLDAKINDGWSDYPAGDYLEIYNITVAQ